MRNVRLDESEAGIKTAGRNVNNYQISEISILNIKKQRHYFANKGPSSQDYGFSSGHVWM